MPHQRLTIHPAPFKPSHLSIPPSPFSPLSPLTPASTPHKQPRASEISTSTTSAQPAPSTPLQWIWTCHACTRAYPLGATRRCLDDGHHFCSGTTVVKSRRKTISKRQTKSHKACRSEFDYLGWKHWGRWKRTPLKPNILQSRNNAQGNAKGAKDCWRNCDYPSHCRWGKQVGIHTPSPTRATFDVHSDTPGLGSCIDLPSLDECFVASPPAEAERSIGALGRALETSANRRKSLRGTCTSPLASEISVPTAREFDVEMVDEKCIDPALLALSGTDTSPSINPAIELTNKKQSSTKHKLKSLLSLTYPRSNSRQHTPFPPVSNTQRKLKRRHALPALKTQHPPTSRHKQLLEVSSPLETARRWTENALNVV